MPIVKSKNGNTINQPQELAEVWAEHFEALATPSMNNEYDYDFQKKTETDLQGMYADSFGNRNQFLKQKFSYNEVNAIVMKLKNGKVGGLDGCDPEHFKYGGSLLRMVLCVIYNSIVHNETLPSNFLCSLDVPVFKGGSKDPLDVDSYRKISLVSIMSKIFEMLLSSRTDKWFNPGLLGLLQGGSHKNCSSMEVSFLVQESIAALRDQGHNVYLAALDSRKAFDTVWHPGLFLKLYQAGMNSKLWRILLAWYQEAYGVVIISSRLDKMRAP